MFQVLRVPAYRRIDSNQIITRWICAIVSFLCVCPLIDDKLRHNIVKVAVEPRAAGEWFRSKLWQCYHFSMTYLFLSLRHFCGDARLVQQNDTRSYTSNRLWCPDRHSKWEREPAVGKGEGGLPSSNDREHFEAVSTWCIPFQIA